MSANEGFGGLESLIRLIIHKMRSNRRSILSLHGLKQASSFRYDI